MRFLARLMVEFQVYQSQKRIKRQCLSCNEVVVPRRQLSTLNLGAYIILGIISYFLFKKILVSFLVPVVLIALNSLFLKKSCPKCRGTEFAE